MLSLPDGPAFLKPLIVQLFETLQSHERRIQQLEQHMDLLLRRVFGKSSEKLDLRQLVLAFAELSAETAPPATSEPPAAPDVPAANSAQKPVPACWLKSWSASTAIICRCIVRNGSSCDTACGSHDRRCAAGALAA